MNLTDYQTTMLALIQGETDAVTAATRLYGEADARTVQRLADYRMGYLGANDEGLSIQHPQTRAVVEARLGRAGWRALVARFLVAHPPRHAHRVVAYAPFSDFVAADPALPAWLGELARLERAALLADLAPDSPQAAFDAETCVIALDWDVLGWSADGASPALDPEARSNLILTWRGADDEPLQAEVGPLEALALASLRRGEPASAEEIAALGATEEDLGAALDALIEIGAVRASALNLA